MLHPKYRWVGLHSDAEAASLLAEQAGIPKIVASLLLSRGIQDAQEARHFLQGTMEDLHDPYLLSGMQEAVARIRRAVEQDEQILIYGDYDADGVSSTALMVCLMRHLNARFEYYIPHRSKEGYGLHISALEPFVERGFTLVITVDTGISAVEQIAYANAAGMDVIVTDHHEPPEVLPEAYALVNPKLPYCKYPFKGLAGVGVAYKLATALLADETPAAWTELVTLGTIADLMPLTDENRILVTNGLKAMAYSSFPGITALMGAAGYAKSEPLTMVSSTNVAFGLAPRINASGRMSHANQAVALLTTQSIEEAEKIAEDLDILNKERQLLVDSIVQEAIAQLAGKEAEGALPGVIVLAGEGWNPGVIGIVASKILDRYYRPTIVLGIDPETGTCKGSARSIPGLDIYEALTHCKGLLDHYGGHPSAAGMTLHRSQLAKLEEQLNEFAAGVLCEEHFIPVMYTDLECRLSDISLPVIEQLENLAPFGMGNTCPRLLIRGAKLVERRSLGKEGKHMKLVLSQDGTIMEAVAFGKGELLSQLTEEARIDVVAEASINEWNGSRKPQLMIQDLAVPHIQVFDYRGASHPVVKMNEIRRQLIEQQSLEQRMIAVVAVKDSELTKNYELNDTPCWIYDKDVGVIPGNTAAQLNGQNRMDIKILFVLELPESFGIWHKMMGAFASLERVYLFHPARDRQEAILPPSREQFKQIYALLKQQVTAAVPEEELIPSLMRRTRLSRRMLVMTLEVFEELGFIHRDMGKLTVIQAPAKRALDTSRRYLELGELAEMEQILHHAGIPQITQWLMTNQQNVS
ncbi:single-stranded-DNA-specific exonuclease RecJ [Paenibacillus woosongensis]|uniref:Single-stranded-DNA-specific exonuclease RecJ n=1 Tax=Paenibacillus woosongensis TaxID=307580 RepID=A0AA95I398_9BACL|nr:single-stranded-DNA-specific exonuclease RecJ [Paenibacillus woosongensis]WHX48046.1 single-stranded-DNA-specific exonuclease RecJ [Paenibacillus woosongensis]